METIHDSKIYDLKSMQDKIAEMNINAPDNEFQDTLTYSADHMEIVLYRDYNHKSTVYRWKTTPEVVGQIVNMYNLYDDADENVD